MSVLHVPLDGVLQTKFFSWGNPAGFSSCTGSNRSFIYEVLQWAVTALVVVQPELKLSKPMSVFLNECFGVWLN